MKFTKMHGIGNDYVYVNCFEETVENPSAVARVPCAETVSAVLPNMPMTTAS